MGGRFVGQTLAGRYDVLELLGAGGMGDVYRARDRELDELVALKVIRDELAGDPEIVARFRHEVKLARRVTHANVARTYELGTADGALFCTMELIDGVSLARHVGNRALPVAEATSIAAAICAALAAAHAAGVIHRDVKPDNVLVASDGRVVVADFGVAAVALAGRGHGELSGTPAYMAPEQAAGDAPTPAADVYAVGVMLYEMLTGRRPFAGGAVKILDDKRSVERLTMPDEAAVPVELAAVVARATERDVAARIETAEELRRALEPWATPRRQAIARPRTHADAGELRTLIVLAPRAASDNHPLLYLADAAHEELLHQLARRPRVRVYPRANDTGEPGATVIELSVGDRLAITVTHRDASAPALELGLPLAVESIASSARIAAQAIATTLELAGDPGDSRSNASDELLYLARYGARRNMFSFDHLLATLERALGLAPDDPRIAAGLARALALRAFFKRDADPALLARATALARQAVATSPELAEAHLAAGHVELHSGEPEAAAGHFRVAIACSPFQAEAHEWLGRMLMEAGHIDLGMARLAEAIAIVPHLASAQWEIARSYALEQRWDEHDRLVDELVVHSDRAFMRARFAFWRGDRARLDQVHRELAVLPDDVVFLPVVLDSLVHAQRGEWLSQRDALLAAGLDDNLVDRRRRAFTAQLSAELAAAAGDLASTARLVAHATDNGLFDLLWLDRCPALARARDAGVLAASRVLIKRRADAILDALYGDHALHALGATVAATHST